MVPLRGRRPRTNARPEDPDQRMAKLFVAFLARFSVFFSAMVLAGFFLASRLLERSFDMVVSPEWIGPKTGLRR